MTKLEKQAKRGEELVTAKYDLQAAEIEVILDKIEHGKSFDAISQAFLVGYVRGHEAAQQTKRGE